MGEVSVRHRDLFGHIASFQALRTTAHNAIKGKRKKPRAPRFMANFEPEVLRLVAKGFHYGEITGLLEISSHTVTTHVRHIYRKLGVHSRGAAVHEAVSRRIIDL